MGERMKIDTRIRKEVKDGTSPDDVAIKVLKEASREELAELAYGQVFERARMIARELVLWAERKVESQGRVFYQAVIERDPLTIGTSFYVEGHGVCYWDTATAEQHEIRAQTQRRGAESLIEDAERHEKAAAKIRKAKVQCLADLQHELEAA
jgi:hypothetical protein